MDDAASKLFDSLNSFSSVEKLISDGESENQYLECKSPQSPNLDKGLKQELATTISAFANSGGGVIIWGVSTTNHQHSGLDILSQIEPIGQIKRFASMVDLAIRTAIEPPNIECKLRTILELSTSKRGVLITYIPGTTSDPIRTTADRKFYIRIGDKVSEMPYEILKRMFAGSTGPDIEANFDAKIVKSNPDGSWEIPIVLLNKSSAAGKDVAASVQILNPDSCESVSAKSGFVDSSHINPGKKVFMEKANGPIFKGQNLVLGSLGVKMKKNKRALRKLVLVINIFASHMRAKTFTMTIQLSPKKGFSVKKTDSGFLY